MIRTWLVATLRGDIPALDESKTHVVDEVLATAFDHGVTMLLNEQIKLNQDRVVYPPDLLNRLAEIERNEIASELFRLAETRRTLSSLEEAGIPVIVLKGTALAYSLYPKPHLRPRADTDLLFQNAEVAEAAGMVLKSIGYHCSSLMAKPSKNAISFEVEYRSTSKFGSSQALDVHWALANNALYCSRFTNAELLLNARELPLLGRKAKGLSLLYAMAHACVHRVAHIPEGQGDKLIWLYDIHLLSREFSEKNWQDFLQIAEHRQLAGAFHSGLQATVITFDTRVPPSVMLALLNMSKKERFKVDNATSAAYIDLHGLFWMSNPQRWHWFLQTFFPPAKYMMKRDGLKSRAQLPWAYVKRIIKRLL